VSQAEYLASIRSGIGALWTSRGAGTRWIDQTPTNTLVADGILELFPQLGSSISCAMDASSSGLG